MEKEFIVVDIETTGIKPEYNQIIEICALKIKNGKIVDKFQTFVKPYKKKIPKKVVELTGITDEMLENAPNSFKAMEAFMKFIGNKIIIYHNASFDNSRTLFKKNNKILPLENKRLVKFLKFKIT